MRNKYSAIRIFFLGLFALAFVTPAFAQVDQMSMANRFMNGRSVNYYYAKPGDITITVSIWGFIQRPGLYEVASSTNLINLISLAGGPNSYAKLTDVNVVRVRKDKDGNLTRSEFTVNLKDLTHVTQKEIELKPGDVIYVNHTAWYTVKEVFSVASGIGIFMTSIYYLSRILTGR